MYSKLPVWLLTNDLIKKYQEFCFSWDISEKYLIKLCDANLLTGHPNRKLKKHEVLEESFLQLLLHVNYNLEKLKYHTIEEIISVPIYCRQDGKIIRYDMDKNWYSATELIEKIPAIKIYKTYSVEFLNELVNKGVLRGKYDKTEKINYILLASFIELIEFRNYILHQTELFPPKQD